MRSSDREPSPAAKRFEGDRVRYILKRFGLTRVGQDLLADWHERFGERRLTFASFHHRFPTFPVRFGISYISRFDERVAAADLFHSKRSSILLDVFYQAYVTNDDPTIPLVVVVPFGGVRQGMAIHTADIETAQPQLRWPISPDIPPGEVTIEPLSGLLQALAGAAWRPDQPGLRVQTVDESRPAEFLGARVAASTVRELGSGPATIVWSWLVGVIADDVKPTRGERVRLNANEFGVRVGLEDLVKETGLSLDAVKRGLQRLRKLKWVRSIRRQNFTIYVPGD